MKELSLYIMQDKYSPQVEVWRGIGESRRAAGSELHV
jgi:hypothetical protein